MTMKHAFNYNETNAFRNIFGYLNRVTYYTMFISYILKIHEKLNNYNTLTMLEYIRIFNSIIQI